MSRTTTLFGSPLLLGFEHVERLLERVAKSGADGYPPYNIERTGESELRITLAVAGFKAEDLDVSVEDSQLVVRGLHADDRERVYLHRGIAARQFQRAFVLAEGIEIKGAELDNGLLHVDLCQPKPISAVKRVPIRSAPGSKADLDLRSGARSAPGGGTPMDVAEMKK